MKRLLAGWALATTLLATAAHAQNATGHIAYTGSSFEFEDNHENSTVVASGRYNYEFMGFGAGWTRFVDPAAAPTGLGVTTLPDGRRCVFWTDSEQLRHTCELYARRGDWSPAASWKQPPLGPTSTFRFRRIAVLGPSNPEDAITGQIPMVFAIAYNSNVLMLRKYENGRWDSWQSVATLLQSGSETPTAPADISAAWARDPLGFSGLVEINITAGALYHRLWIPAHTAVNSAPRDLSNAMPDVGEAIHRMAPLPTYGDHFGSRDFGMSLYVTSSGALYESTSDWLVHSNLHSLAVPAPVRGITAFGPRFNYRLYMIDTSGNGWTTTYVAGVLGPWRFME